MRDKVIVGNAIQDREILHVQVVSVGLNVLWGIVDSELLVTVSQRLEDLVTPAMLGKATAVLELSGRGATDYMVVHISIGTFYYKNEKTKSAKTV